MKKIIVIFKILIDESNTNKLIKFNNSLQVFQPAFYYIHTSYK